MKGASEDGDSVQYERGVPQKPQKYRLDDGWLGEVYVRRMEVCVSSGKYEMVWEEYQESGIRSQDVRGAAWDLR